jgi:ComF family protein
VKLDLDALVRALSDAVYPRLCPLCGAFDPDGRGCDEHRLPDGPPGPRCDRCARALAAVLPDGYRCAHCRTRAPGWRTLVCLGDYRGQASLREWVLALKHGGRKELARPLGRALAARLAQADPESLLVPVPVHFARRLERGYDQAVLLAQWAAEASGLECVRALRRVRATAEQGGPLAHSRASNVRGAFEVRRRSARRVEGKSVWLVDDVVTSGSTARECARALRRAGAARVDVLAVARAG